MRSLPGGDKQGRSFVGPAGRVLDRALDDVGIDRDRTYVTNAVKHFRFRPLERGKRKLHRAPTRAQILACRPWLSAELELLRPDVLVCLGATAAKALFGPDFELTEHRGERLELPVLEAPPEPAPEHPRPLAFVTIHPSAVLRAEDRDDVYDGFVRDLTVVAEALYQNAGR